MIHDRIPIIILNWHGLDDTKECMNSVLNMQGQDYEVILVDNGSGTEEQDALMSLYGEIDNVSLVLNTENKGFTRGNSDIVEEIMAREVVPPYIALLNNDTVVDVDWIAALVRSAEENAADMISSKMINYFDRSKIDNVGHYMQNTGEILPIGHNLPVENYQEGFENMGACGGAVLYRSSMIADIGFFDPFFETGYEDAEYGLRAKLLGYKCLFEPSAIIYHKISQSLKKVIDDRYLQRVQINIFYTYFKLMPLRFLSVNVAIVLGKYLLWLLFGVLGLQFRLIKLHLRTIWRFFANVVPIIRSKRRAFHSSFEIKKQYRSSIRNPTVFFLIPDVKRLMLKAKVGA